MSSNRASVHSAFGPAGEGPATVVFATLRYRHIVRRWIELAHRAGCRNYRIVCMDRDIARLLRDEVGAHRAPCFYDFLPDLPRFADEPPDAPPDPDRATRWRKHRERMQVLMPLRVKFFRLLLEHGCDFIHSDADAFWLADPRPVADAPKPAVRPARLPGHRPAARPPPRPRFRAVHGVLPLPRQRPHPGLFARADALIETSPRVPHAAAAEMDDQTALNRALLEDPGRRWRVERTAFAVRYRWKWRSVSLGRIGNALLAGALARRLPAALLDGALGLVRSPLILTSERVILGRFAGGLRVGVIPMRLVDRIDSKRTGAAGPARPLVSHLKAHKALVPNDPHAAGHAAPGGSS